MRETAPPSSPWCQDLANGSSNALWRQELAENINQTARFIIRELSSPKSRGGRLQPGT